MNGWWAHWRLFASICAVLLAAGCGGSGPADPGEPEPPRITITGVAEGQTYAGPVTIVIEVDRGSFSALLDGVKVSSGTVVSAPGQHVLVVSASEGLATATKEVRFTIAGAPGGALIVRLLDLGPNASGGGGDAILLTDSSAAGQFHGLIDAGPAGENGSDPGYVARQLKALGVGGLEFVQLTHAHEDHYGGLGAVLDAHRAKRFIYNGQKRNLRSYEEVLEKAQGADSLIVPTGTAVYSLRLGPGEQATLAMVLPPLPTFIQAFDPDSSGQQLNEGSLGTEVRLGTFRMFLTGDGEVRANARWRSVFSSYSRDVSVLKAGHHGANDAVFDNGFSGASSWLTHTDPEAVVISANGTTHPRANALTRLLEHTSRRTYCTSVHGRIEIRVQRSGTYTITVEKNAASDCGRGTQATS